MNSQTWTADELSQFDVITQGLSSKWQMDRIKARLELRAFIEKHGKMKCDAMFEALRNEEKKS